MKRLSTGVLAALFAAGLGLSAAAASTNAPHGNIGHNAVAQDAMSAAPAANFGSPPSGQIPILFNDHHVYAKPDTLKQGRVLAALVRGGTVLIPLRSMFEQMGATVSYDPASKTVDVSKAGADVKVTVGQKTVVINGESRPLDVPPMIWKGQVLVPIRVLSEGMGAYVEWVSDKQLVVVRYVVPTPPPTPAPTEAPTAAPTEAPTAPPTPTPAPAATPYHDVFIAGDYIVSPTVYNEFSAGTRANPSGQGGPSLNVRGAAEFDVFNLPWMIEGDLRAFKYEHACASAADPACLVTIIGGGGSTSIPQMAIRDFDFSGRLGLRVANPRLYVGVGYLIRNNSVGYPKQTSVGFGAEKLPDLNQTLSWYGSAYYYPNVKGTCNAPECPAGPISLEYNETQFQLGANWWLRKWFSEATPFFLDFGVIGDRGQTKLNAPSAYSHFGGYVGLGIKF